MPYVKPSQRIKRKLSGDTELHIVPVMNLFLALIPFMLLAAVFVQISVLDTTLPAVGDASQEEVKKEEEKPRLNLTIAITDEGFYVGGAGGVIAERGKKTTVPRAPDGTYDFDKLASILKKIKAKYPDENDVIVVAEDSIDYQLIVSTMDTIDKNFSSVKYVVENGQKKKVVLHPNISLGASVQ